MEKIKLFTHGGEFVTEVSLPPFRPKAEIIMWGTRFFVLGRDDQYREGMIAVAFPFSVTVP